MINYKNKIVMINSFKGGAGKTSLALSYCVTEAINVKDTMSCYLDVDLLGTGSAYTLFNEEDFGGLKYLNEYNFNSHSEFTRKICFIDQNNNPHEIYAAIIDPANRIKNSFSGKNMFRSNEGVLQSSFYNKITDFILKTFKNKESNLIVIDCSPGLTSFEVDLMYAMYKIKDNKEYKCDFEEIYVTTFDYAHVRKTIDCLSENIKTFKRDISGRKISIIMNDVHNCKGIEKVFETSASGRSFNLDLEDISKIISSSLNVVAKNDDERNELDKINLLHRQYEMDLCASNIITNRRMLINNVDAYYFNGINFKPLNK